MMNLRLCSILRRPLFVRIGSHWPLFTTGKGCDDEWNNAWESAWLPPEDDLAVGNRGPWEADVNFSLSDNNNNNNNHSALILPEEVDAETKAFVEDMTDNWEHRRGKSTNSRQQQNEMANKVEEKSLYNLENIKKDYRLKKQRIHAALWTKEIEKHEEAKLADAASSSPGDDIDKLLDRCSDIFDSSINDLNNTKVSSSSEYNNKPQGWETISKAQDGNIWEVSQREEDILVQEFERRLAFNKFQIASFIKTHIFSRRRPIDGWKYMIEELGPNARKGKGSISRLPSLSDASTQPFKQEKIPISSYLPNKER